MAAYEASRHRENNHGIIVTPAVVLQTRQCRRCGGELAAVQDCSAAGMSDAAEEVAWPALRVVAPQPSCAAARARAGGDADGGPLSPAVAAVGSETAAAVNLLSMSVRDSDLPGAPADCGGRQGPGARAWAGPRAAQPARPAPEGAAAAGAAAAAGPDARTYAPTDARAAGRSPAAERCARGSPAAEAAGRAPAAPACSDRYGWGPLPLAADEEERRLGDPGAAAAAEAEGAALREARDGAAREAAAADAAVAAVAKARAPGGCALRGASCEERGCNPPCPALAGCCTPKARASCAQLAGCEKRWPGPCHESGAELACAAQILAVKQAAATRARAAAAAAAQSLEAFLGRTSLDGARSPHKKARRGQAHAPP